MYYCVHIMFYTESGKLCSAIFSYIICGSLNDFKFYMINPAEIFRTSLVHSELECINLFNHS
jgi:hypothetical protein